MKLSKAIEGFTISRLADRYCQNTLEAYSWALNLLTDFLTDPDIGEITSDHLRQFFFFLRSEYKPNRPNGDDSPLTRASLQSVWKAVRSFFNRVSSELNIDRPDTNIKAPEVRPRAISPFTEEEVKSLLNACQYTNKAVTEKRNSFAMSRPTSKRDRALVMTLLDTGLRVSEICRLRTRDINLETGEVLVEPYGSGRKTISRHVYIGKATRRVLWFYLAGREELFDDAPIFLTKDNRPMNRHYIRQLLSRLGMEFCPSKTPKAHIWGINSLRDPQMCRKHFNTIGPHSSLDYQPPAPAAFVGQSTAFQMVGLS